MTTKHPGTTASGLTSNGIDAIKGVAILAVVLGHNSVLIGRYPNLWHVIYAFNIFPFLFFPFLFPARPLNCPYAADRVVRYLVPWALVYLLCSWFFFLQSRDLTWTAWLANVGLGLIVGTAPLVKAASGFQLFWFLPCLFALVLLRAACSRWPRAGAALVMGAGVLLLAAVGLLPQSPLQYVPATAHVALMMCPVGATLAWSWQRFRGTVPRWAMAFVFGGVWFGLSVWIYLFPVNAEHSSLTIREPAAFAVRIGVMMSSFLFLCATSNWLGRMPVLVALGRHSLIIYLTSSLWFQVWLRLERVLELPAWYSESFALRVATSLLFSLAAAYLVSRALTEFEPVRRWAMPRFWAEWPPTAWCPVPGQATVAGIERR